MHQDLLMARHPKRSADVVMVVARNIRRFREARRESQLGFAERTGINRSRLNGWEGGARAPSLKNLQKIADGLEVEVWELVRDNSSTPC